MNDTTNTKTPKIERAWLGSDGQPVEGNNCPNDVTGRRFSFDDGTHIDVLNANVKVPSSVLIAYACNHIVGDAMSGAKQYAEENSVFYAEAARHLAEAKIKALADGVVRVASESGPTVSMEARIIARMQNPPAKPSDIQKRLDAKLAELGEEGYKKWAKAARGTAGYKAAKVAYDLERAQARAGKLASADNTDSGTIEL